MRLRLTFACALLSLVLGGCSSTPSQPLSDTKSLVLPQQLLVEHTPSNGLKRLLLLVIQPHAQGSQWSLFDPLGMPRERMLLTQGQWQREGLLPPFKLTDSRELFAAVLFALKPRHRLAEDYPQAREVDNTRCLTQAQQCRWQVDYHANGTFSLRLANQQRFELQPLGAAAEAQP
ncbi:hypothetical protein [Atopomonas sediminilitoris]|uniref:hypothetical protein n=1 Tax=Atopomonas sediminilitoris TaxID=2919919 RepID=UPI001F4E6573|nr:hypothetical protein [Atopomonas sediminilitoris]MCJ8170377.1 hypothetical protein [Atopomonas sediminilitoris]